MSHKQNYLQNIVNENQIRIYSGLVVMFMSAYVFSSNEIFLYLLIYDFFATIYMSSKISPLYIISTFLVKIINFKNKPRDSFANEFASHIGLTLLFVALLADLNSESATAFFIVLLLSVWKFVDVVGEFCLVCKFYEFLKLKNIEVVSL